jgi:hypothetical protein
MATQAISLRRVHYGNFTFSSITTVLIARTLPQFFRQPRVKIEVISFQNVQELKHKNPCATAYISIQSRKYYVNIMIKLRYPFQWATYSFTRLVRLFA